MKYKSYEKYKESEIEWLGKIPHHWNINRLKYFCDIQTGDKDTVNSICEGEYPFFVRSQTIEKINSYTFDCEAILTAGDGAGVGKVFHYFIGRFDFHQRVYMLNNFRFLLGKFLFYFLRDNFYRVALDGTAKSTVDSLRLPLLLNFPMVAPPKNEQKKIVDFLDSQTKKIDALIEKQKKLIELLKEKRQAMISYAVMKGLDPKVKMKDSGVEWLGEAPKHWDINRLKYFCDIQTGDKDTVNSIPEGEYPFFVRSQTIEKINSYTFDCEAILTAGDGAGVGKVFHYYIGRFDFHQRVYMLNNFRFLLGKFLFYFLRENFYRVALDGAAKSTVDSLRLPLLLNFPIVAPPKNEQKKIVDFLDSQTKKIDTLIKKSTQVIDLLNERRSALIFAAVTGKIDVRNFVCEKKDKDYA